MGVSSGHGPYNRALRRRRIVALIVVVAMVGMMVAGAVAGLVGVVRGDASVDTARAQPTVASSSSTTTDAPSTTQRVDPWAPSPGDPARVLIVGDSDAGAFGPSLLRLLEPTGIVTTTLDYKVS